MNENWNEWDEHVYTILLIYKFAFKVRTSHTPFQLIYGLQSLLFTKYLSPHIHDPTHVRI